MYNMRSVSTLDLIAITCIVAATAAVIAPVAQRVGEAGAIATCQSNEAAIGLSLAQYVQDYDEKYPARYNSATGRSGEGWAAQISPYVTQGAASFHCPLDYMGTKLCNGVTAYPVSYGLNENAASAYQLQVLDTSRTPMLFEVAGIRSPLNVVDQDMCQLPGYMAAVGDGFDNKLYSGPASATAGRYATGDMGGRGTITPALGRHSTQSNFLAFDGHAMRLPGANVSDGLSASGPNAPQGATTAAGVETLNYDLSFSVD